MGLVGLILILLDAGGVKALDVCLEILVSLDGLRSLFRIGDAAVDRNLSLSQIILKSKLTSDVVPALDFDGINRAFKPVL